MLSTPCNYILCWWALKCKMDRYTIEKPSSLRSLTKKLHYVSHEESFAVNLQVFITFNGVLTHFSRAEIHLELYRFSLLSANPTKWPNTQTIRRLTADELFECVWPFCGVGAWRVNTECSYFISLWFLVKPNADETVRVVNYHTSHRHLLRGFKRKVEDIAFESFKSNRLACIDSEGTVFVFNIYESGEDVKYLFNDLCVWEKIVLRVSICSNLIG